jgi:hypothetical protein
MTEEITGYKFQVEAAAKNAQNSLRVHYLGNRPSPPQGETWTTTEWVSVEFNDGASGTFYYFQGDFAPVLGNPSIFNIDIEEI